MKHSVLNAGQSAKMLTRDWRPLLAAPSRRTTSKLPLFSFCLLVALLIIPVLAQTDEESLMFAVQTDVLKPATTEEFLRYTFPPNNTQWLNALTICVRIKILQFRDMTPFFSYAYSDRADNALLMFQFRKQLDYYIDDLKLSSGLNLQVEDFIDTWHMNCIIVDHPNYRVYIDGELLIEGSLQGSSTDIPLNGTLYVGQDQDRFNGGTDREQTLSGYAAQLNLWSYALDETTLKDMAACHVNLRGNVLSSDRDNFDHPGVTVEIVPHQRFCREEANFVVVPLVRTVVGARSFCSLVDGFFFIPEDEETNNRLHKVTDMFTDVCDFKSYRRLLLAGTDEEQEGVWINMNTRKPLNFTAWAAGEPNNGKNDNCVVLRKDSPTWGDLKCDYINCFSCSRTWRDYFYIRGLCRLYEHEIRFIMDGYVNTRPFFRGYYGMTIYYVGKGSWAFKDTMAGVVLATMTMEQPEEYPLGRTEWDVVEPFCDFAAETKINLGLSACTTHEFMCSDGSCVPRHERCNLREDCLDGSDESECGIVLFSGRYASHRPPPGRSFREVLYVQPHVHLVRFSKIDDINLAFYMEFEVHLTWTDRNLKFKNIKEEEDKNKLSASEVDSIWTPEIEFLNVNDGLLKKLKSNVYARQVGDPEPPDFNDAMMETIFEPVNASLVTKKFYSASFSCNFYLFKYPFDTQSCSLLIKLDSADTTVVTFTNDSVVYSGLLTLPKYDVRNIESELSERTGYAVLEVKFALERRWSLLVLTIFIPTILLLGIGYVTLFVQLEAIQVRSIMTLTTLLVLYTLFNQVSTGLPDTAYIKMIDMWFFFCIFLIFSVIVLHVVVEYLPRGRDVDFGGKNLTRVSPIGFEQNEVWLTGVWVMRMTRIFIYPALLLIFNVVFWLAIFNLQ